MMAADEPGIPAEDAVIRVQKECARIMEIREDEEINDLLRRGYRILQKKSGFRFGIDAVLLAWFAGEVKDSDRVIDLGSGTGVVPLLMDARNGHGQYIGLEIDPVMTEMASRSALMNGCEDRVRFVRGDIREASECFGTGAFDIVTSNPPYWKAGTGKLNPDPMKAAARHEVLCTLRDVVREASALLKEGGRFYMVHRAERKTEILDLLPSFALTPRRLLPICPSPGKEANLLLVAAEKTGLTGHITYPGVNRAEAPGEDAPLCVYDGQGNYSEDVLHIYRE